MPDDEIGVRLRLLDKQRFIRDTKDGSAAVRGIGETAERTGKRSSRAFGLMSGGLLGVARAAKYGAAVAIGAVVWEAKRSVEAFEESRKVAAQTNAVLESTGGEANVTRRQIDRMSDSLSRKTGIDDEAIQGAQNLLLTFRAVRNEAGEGNKVFSQTIPVIADMATAMGMDLNSAALQVGKALNNPLTGMTRLQRIGVELNKDQQKQIKTYMKLGDTQAAQGVILDELNKQFGGSAEAQATALDRLQVSVGNIEESFGAMLAPAVDTAAKALDDFLVDAQPELDRISGRIEGVFAKDNLDLGEKFRQSAKLLRNEAEPLGRDFEQLLKDARLDDKLQQAVEWAAPKIADGMAAAAPRAAEAFVNAFKEAGPWGQLLTVAFLASKMGAFRGAADIAADGFTGRFKRQVGQAAVGNAIATTVAGEMADDIGPSMRKAGVGERFKALGRRYGLIMGPALVAVLGWELGEWLANNTPDGTVPLQEVLEAMPGSAAEAKKYARQYREGGGPFNPEVTGVGATPKSESEQIRSFARTASIENITLFLRNSNRERDRQLIQAIREAGRAPILNRVRVELDGELVADSQAYRDLRQRERDGDD